MNLKVALIGYGRMGKTIDALAETYSCDIVERLDIADNADGTSITPDRFNAIDVAIDFSLADAVVPNMKQLGATTTNVFTISSAPSLWQFRAHFCVSGDRSPNVEVVICGNY